MSLPQCKKGRRAARVAKAIYVGDDALLRNRKPLCKRAEQVRIGLMRYHKIDLIERDAIAFSDAKRGIRKLAYGLQDHCAPLHRPVMPTRCELLSVEPSSAVR